MVTDDSGVSVNNGYDAHGEVRTHTRTVGESGELRTVTDRDALGRVVRQQLPFGEVISPAYNTAGQLDTVDVSIADSAVRMVSGVDYDAKGQRLSVRTATELPRSTPTIHSRTGWPAWSRRRRPVPYRICSITTTRWEMSPSSRTPRSRTCSSDHGPAGGRLHVRRNLPAHRRNWARACRPGRSGRVHRAATSLRPQRRTSAQISTSQRCRSHASLPRVLPLRRGGQPARARP